jgi:hypothetical protein
MDADVIAIHVDGCGLFDRRIELVAETPIQFVEETVGRPAELREQVLQARALAIIAEHVLVAKHFGDDAHDRKRLFPAHECVEAQREMWIGGECTSHAKGKANVAFAVAEALDGGQANVVDLGI